MATLDRQGYDKVLKKSQANVLNNHIRFLQSIPFFAKWTKNSLAKFSYYFSKRTLLRNQTLYKEGDLCTHVYLVLKGEFEVRKRVRIKAEEKP